MRANGLIVGLDGRHGFRVTYTLHCDHSWRVRRFDVAHLGDEGSRLYLRADGGGHWTTGEGESVPLLDGCIDVDLSATPLTNALPIRRLGWKRGDSAELAVVYVEVPSLHLTIDRQRYTCLEELLVEGRFRFEQLSSGFTADFTVDRDGLVLDYPGLFRRAWSS